MDNTLPLFPFNFSPIYLGYSDVQYEMILIYTDYNVITVVNTEEGITEKPHVSLIRIPKRDKLKHFEDYYELIDILYQDTMGELDL